MRIGGEAREDGPILNRGTRTIVQHRDRKAERLFSHLAGFKGVLQVDGYNAYRKLTERGEVELAFRWVHMRRNFYELATAGRRILCDREEIRDRSAQTRYGHRHVTAAPHSASGLLSLALQSDVPYCIVIASRPPVCAMMLRCPKFCERAAASRSYALRPLYRPTMAGQSPVLPVYRDPLQITGPSIGAVAGTGSRVAGDSICPRRVRDRRTSPETVRVRGAPTIMCRNLGRVVRL